jgi:hypothetical protein
MEWKLVPASEGYHYNDDGYRSEVLGTTPQAGAWPVGHRVSQAHEGRRFHR